MKSIKTLSLLIVLEASNQSCFIPPKGVRYSYNQLIENTETITTCSLI